MTEKATNTYQPRFAMVRAMVDRWLSTLPQSCAAEHTDRCPACGSELSMRREKSPAPGVKVEVSARCTGAFCVKL